MTTLEFWYVGVLRVVRPSTVFCFSANLASLTIWAVTGKPVALPL